MLSKRLNDVIFIGVIVVVIASIIALRFWVLGTMDERIETIESENQAITAEISGLQQLIANHKEDEFPPVSRLYQRAPSHYSQDRLLYLIYAQLELAGISQTEDRNLSITLTENPSFLQDTEFHTLANELDAVRITIVFYSSDESEIYDAIHHMHGIQQRFVLQSVRYDMPVDDLVVRVTMDFVTFYNISE